MLNLFVPLLINIAAGLLVWVYSVKKHNVNMVDSLWGLMFWFAALYWFLQEPIHSSKDWLILALVTFWSWRLAIYLTHRNWSHAEDHRYQTIRKNNDPGFWWKSSYIIFGLQALLAWIASLGIYGALQTVASDSWNWLDSLALALWLVGITFEWVGDYQLAKFRSQSERDQVLNVGLWRYTRHPNYFGEFCIWWGIYLFSLSAGVWWAVISPLLMTFLLLKVSGVVMMEATIFERRPTYRDYVERTSSFFPWFPQKCSNQLSKKAGSSKTVGS